MPILLKQTVDVLNKCVHCSMNIASTGILPDLSRANVLTRILLQLLSISLTSPFSQSYSLLNQVTKSLPKKNMREKDETGFFTR